jgi:HlyD family secretion protein
VAETRCLKGQKVTTMNYERNFSHIDTAAGESATLGGRRKRWPLLVGLLLFATILLGAWYAFSRSPNVAPINKATPGAQAKGGKAEKESPSVTVIVPGQTAVSNILSATGTLAARRDIAVSAVGEGGQVVRVLAESGQWVHAGQVLAVVDRQVQVQQSGQIVAQIRVAESDARLAQNELDRARALASRGFVSKADIDRKTAQRDGAMARVSVAKAQLGENSARLRRLDIRAPASGLVLARSVEVGQVVGPASGPLFRIAKDGEFELLAHLSEADLAHSAVGHSATVTPVGSDRSFAGRIWQIAPIIDPQTRQGTARISIPYDRALRPGGFASVKIDSGSIQAPLLPESAVQSDSKGSFVYIVDANNVIVRRDVIVGTINDNGVSIVGGLDGTEMIVQSAGGFLNPGETVVPKRATPVQ